MIRYPKQVAIAVLAAWLPFAAAGESCADKVAWVHTHDTTKKKIETTDIKGSGDTLIEVCREKDDSGKGLEVLVVMHGRPAPLAEGGCVRRLAKYMVIKSTGAEAAPGVGAVARGTTQICRD